MKTIYVTDADERYPDYNISEVKKSYSLPIRVSEKTLSKWKKIISDYDKLQEKLRFLFEREDRKTWIK